MLSKVVISSRPNSPGKRGAHSIITKATALTCHRNPLFADEISPSLVLLERSGNEDSSEILDAHSLNKNKILITVNKKVYSKNFVLW
jgi:hypothetical protein